MRKKILSIALAVMMAIPTMPVMATSDKDVLGDWYANIYGVGIQVTFRKGGSYLISMDGVNNGDPEEGTWKMTGDAITLDEGEENSMNLTVKGNSISADNGEFTLSREETEYDGYTPAKVVDADEKDFDGIWKADYVSTGNITAPVDVFGISGAFISVKSGKLELFLNSDVYEKPLDAEDLTVEFKDNTCTFTSEKDEEKDAEKNTSKYEYDIKNYVGGETTIEKKNKAEAIGAAVFEKDKMVGELGEVETEICKILKGDYTYSYLTYYNNDTPDIPITVKTTQQKKPKYKIDTDKKTVDIELYIESDLYSLPADYNVENKIEDFERNVANYTSSTCTEFINNFTKKYNSDILKLNEKVKYKFLTNNQYNWFKKNVDWSEYKFSVCTDFKVRRTGLIVRK